MSSEAGVEVGDQLIEARVGAEVEVRATDQPTEAGAYHEMEARAGDQLVEKMRSSLQSSAEVPLEVVYSGGAGGITGGCRFSG